MLNVNELSGFGAGGNRSPHRYWRIHSVTNPGHSYFGFHNIEMRGSVGGADLTGSGTPIYGGGTLSGTVDLCFDADCDSVAVTYDTTYPPGAWIGYDFFTPVLVNEMFISWFDSVTEPTDLSVQYSDDNLNWTEDKLFTAVPWGVGNDPVCARAYPWAVLTL